jgi:DNA-directed RNA polymerase specialized sigma24 family protein
VGAIVRKVARRKLHLFGRTPDVGMEDIEQEALLAVRRAKGFDPAKARASTWVYLIASRTAFDMARKRARLAKQDVLMARPDVTHQHPADRRYVADKGKPITDEAGAPVAALAGWAVTLTSDDFAVLDNGQQRATIVLRRRSE